MHDFKPAISHGAWRQDLDGIGQTGPGFTDGIVDDTIWKVPYRSIDHKAPDKHAGGCSTMERFCDFYDIPQMYAQECACPYPANLSGNPLLFF